VSFDIPFVFAIDILLPKSLDWNCDDKRVKACSVNADVSRQVAEEAHFTTGISTLAHLLPDYYSLHFGSVALANPRLLTVAGVLRRVLINCDLRLVLFGFSPVRMYGSVASRELLIELSHQTPYTSRASISYAYI
jgi:hypothetical protein